MTSALPAVAAVSLFAVLTASPCPAADLPMPEGPVVLTITGAIGNTNGEGRADLDFAMLEEIGGAEIVTDTIWTTQAHRFTGVRLRDLLDYVAADGETVIAAAINEYKVEIPLSDATEDGPIVAYAIDGERMSRREKGPLWVIYPFARSPDFRTEVIYTRSIWQLSRMEITD
ncbi:molybdopterin-dependent oxidoreductase [Tropicibacter sp. S64]|uniref:molybdopterin-dependent oxidoreductase n=1 Tax=Tropicibacter sp. S64 TaxID=3415122 RepID=UPI003C7C920B